MSAATSFWAPEARHYAASGRSTVIWSQRLLGLIVVVWGLAFAVGFTQSLTILTVIGLLAAVFGISSPVVGLLGVGILCTIDALTRVHLLSGGLLRWNSFNYLLIAMMALYAGQTIRLVDVHSRLLAAFTMLLTLQLAFSPAVEVGLQTILNVVAAFGILLYFARTGYDRRVLLWLGWVNGTLAAVGGYIYFAQISSLPIMNQNSWSSFPLTALCSVCMAMLVAPPAAHARLCLLGVVNCMWIFLSGSRGAMLMGMVCLAFLLSRMQSVAQKVGVLVLAPIAAVSMLGFFPELENTALYRVTKLFDSDRAVQNRTSGRSDLAKAGWIIFKRNPLGVGTGGFGAEFADMYDSGLSFAGKDVGAHSGWVKVLSENGIIGFVLLVSIVVSFAIQGRRSNVKGAAAAGLFISTLLATAFFSRDFHSKGLWLTTASYVCFVRSGRSGLLVTLCPEPAKRIAS